MTTATPKFKVGDPVISTTGQRATVQAVTPGPPAYVTLQHGGIAITRRAETIMDQWHYDEAKYEGLLPKLLRWLDRWFND